MKRHFETDPMTGAVETFEYDESSGQSYIHRVCDVSDAIEKNKREINNGTNGWVDTEKVFNKVAEIPPDVLYIWLTKYGVRAWDKNHAGAVRRLLDSNEWRYLRTSEIYLGKH